jgi:hypothetical protein
VNISLKCLSLESTPGCRSFIPHGRTHHNGITKNGFQTKSQQILFDSTSARGIRLTCLLIVISFIYVTCTLPISIRLLISDFLPEQKSTSRWQITQLSLTVLMYLNHTVNIRLY